MSKLKTLKITEKTHSELTKVKGRLMTEKGREVTYDEAIMWLIAKVLNMKSKHKR